MTRSGDTETRAVGPIVLAAGLFFLSGAAALVYEVLWSRMLSLEMGATAYALATILTVFMGGLALGSWLGGRVGGKIRRPLRVYGLLEIGVGLYCLAAPLLIDAMHAPMRVIYRQFEDSLLMMSIAQSLLCIVVLAPPVTAMGATLPILAQFVTHSRERIAGSVGALYGVNTFGAFVGAAGTGLFLIPALGVSATNWLAVGTNLLVGVIALAAATRLAPSQPVADAEHAEQTGRPSDTGPRTPVLSVAGSLGPPAWVLLSGFALSGFAAMTLQTAWTRLMTLSIGSTTYAFSLIVGAFILGLALGSALIGRLAGRLQRTTLLLVVCQFGIALTAALTIPLFGELPIRVSLLIAEHPDSLARIQFGEFLAIALIVLPPTVLMGGMLPLVCQCLAASTRSSTASIVGRAYAWNTVGTILGSALAGFALIPLIGMRGAITAGVILNALVGAAYLLSSRGGLDRVSRMVVTAGLLVIATVGSLAMPTWNRAVITSGPYINAIGMHERSGGSGERLRSILEQRADILHYREGVAATVTVREIAGQPWLLVSGKLEASAFEFTQAYLAHLPLLLHPNPQSALVIGLGSGCTLNSAAMHPSLQRIDCVEISPAVTDAARRFFDREALFADERVRLLEGDGRLRLAMTDQTYDVIISQPSNPWMAGASAMFTRECFREMRDRLHDGGVACVWFQGFQVSPETLRIIVATFGDVFPEHNLWASRIGGDYLLTGTKGELPIDPERIRRGMSIPAVARELARDRVLDTADFLGRYMAGPDALRAFAEGAPRNTDDRTILETRIPKEMFLDHFNAIIRATGELAHSAAPALEAPTPALLERLGDIENAQSLIFQAFDAQALGDAQRALELITQACALDPNNYWCRSQDTR